MNEVDILYDFAQKLIKKKDYKKAKQALLKALTYSPESKDIYIALGKVYYLSKQKEHSLRAYLAAMHLQINNFQNCNNEILEKIIDINYSAISAEAKEYCSNKYALIIDKDTNITRHIGHTYIDLYNSETRDPILMECSELYTESLIESKNIKDLVQYYNLCYDDFNNLEKSHYMVIGKQLLFKYIKWKYIEYTKVRKIYFK